MFIAIDSYRSKLTTEFYSNSSNPMNLILYFFGKRMIEDVLIKNISNLKKIIEAREEPSANIAPTKIDTTKEKKLRKRSIRK